MEAPMIQAEPRPDVRPRRRAAAKPSDRKAAPTPVKAKCTLLLSVEASQRLSVHATMMNEDRSALVDKLIREHLRRYRIQDLGGRDDDLGTLDDRRD